jgi:hypothetical protein
VTTETEKTAQVDPLDAFVQEAIDQGSVQEQVETPQVESVPTPEAKTDEPVSEAEPSDGFQKKVNKLTSRVYDQTRRADALQKKLDELNNTPSQEQVKAPTLEDHDYDDEAFSRANISYQVQQELAKQSVTALQAADQVKAQQSQAEFSERITALGKEDFSDKANAVPELPMGVADALMSLDNGAELIYHLGSHLDQADALANMSPMAAMVEIGRMSVGMSKKPEIKPSAAPDPIEPIQAGSALSSEVGDDMSMEDWMAKYG